MRWLIDEFRRQAKDRIAVSIVCEIPLLYVCYVIVSWIWTILTVDDEERLRHSLNYVDWIEIPTDVLAALLLALIVLNIVYVCIARRQQVRIEKEMQSQYAGLCEGRIMYRAPTPRYSQALCYNEHSLFILNGFKHRHVPMRMVTGAELFTRPRRRSRYDLVLIEHIVGSEPDLMLRLKYRDGESESEAEFTLEEHGFEKPETVKLMLLLRESGCDASPYVKN